jgi:hypothetical protein
MSITLNQSHQSAPRIETALWIVAAILGVIILAGASSVPFYMESPQFASLIGP